MDSSGRISIPKRLLKQVKFGPGQNVELEAVDGRLVVRAVSAPSIGEIDERVRARGPSQVRARTVVDALREARDA